MRITIGYICLVVALYFTYRALCERKAIAACYGNKVNATIIDHKIQSVGGGILVYYPVYSYEVDGEIYEYQGKCPLATMMPLGTQIPMHYNVATRSIVEITSIASNLTLTVVFGGISALFLSG